MYIIKCETDRIHPGWMHEISARGWCTGKTQRNQVETEVRGDWDGEGGGRGVQDGKHM